MRRWIRIAGPGEFRGHGSWQQVRGELMEQDFEKCKATSFMPVAWEVGEHDLVKDPRGVMPNFVMHRGMLVNQFHMVAVALPAQADQRSVQYAHEQLKHLLETVLVVDGTVNPVAEA